jgi:ABC-type antimicrobial peptide transport system permease subunit
MFTPDTVTKASAQEAQAADPLSSGVQVVLLLGAACTGLLSVLGIVIHAALTIRSRRVEWAVLRAIGVSARQLTMLIAAEQGLVLLGGTLSGTLVGLMLATVTQPFVQIVTRSGSDTSFVFDWVGLLMLVAGLVLAALLTVGILLLSVQRRGSLAALRLGEEI